MTSFGATSLKAHLSLKGLKFHTPALAAQYSGHLRVVTANKPFAKDVLKLRNGKGMKRDFSYVKIMETFGVEVRGLACYGFRREEVDAYCLTSHATRKVVEGIRERREWMEGRVERRRAMDEGEREKLEEEKEEKAKVEERRVAKSKKTEKKAEKQKKSEKKMQNQKKTAHKVVKQKKIEKRAETQKKKAKKVIKKKTKINKARREGSHCPHNGRDRKSVNMLGSN